MTEQFEYEDDVTRRSKLHLVRDALLVLELEGKPMKPTIFMYSMNMSWTPMVSLVKEMGKRHLIIITAPERLGPRTQRIDKRSNARISISLKGKYLLRILDEMLRYLDDESEPQINPPLWLMRKALATKGFTFMEDLEDLQKKNLLEAPTWLEDPTPFGAFTVDKPHESVIPDAPKLNPSQKAGISFTLSPVESLPPIRDRRPYKKDVELHAGFSVISRDEEILMAMFNVVVMGLYCPECGYKANSQRGLSIHAGHKHPDKKKEIMAIIARCYAKVA